MWMKFQVNEKKVPKKKFFQLVRKFLKINESRDICSSKKLLLAAKLLIKREQQKILHIFLEKISQIICQNF